MARKKMRLLVRVVYASDQDVFEREPLLFVLCIIVASRKQRLDVVFAVDRHDLIAHFVGRAVQRDCETNLQWFVCKFFNSRRHTAGREGDVPRSDAEAPRRINDPNRSHHVLEVRKWFAHSHENDVVDLLPAYALDRDDLIDNFVRAQVARKSFQAARAKLASVSATDLCRNANCPTI